MTLADLQNRQSWTLKQKIYHSLEVIDTFLQRTDNKAYVSFSGGKDSTVLLHLCRIVKPDIKAVFCNTGNEYPDIVKFVRNTPNCEIIYPEMKPQEVIAKDGFPLISKDVSDKLKYSKIYPNSIKGKKARGIIEDDGKYKYKIPNKWSFLINKKYNISDMCCQRLKKQPFHKYEKKTGLNPIIGVMAEESKMRQMSYLKRGGCNSFDGKRFNSMPLAIWTEKDIWDYIKLNKLEVADIYNKGAKRTGCMFCAYGAQYKNDNRFKMVYSLYPKMYNTFMNYKNNAVTYREALREVLAVNGLYLPDEEPETISI